MFGRWANALVCIIKSEKSMEKHDILHEFPELKDKVHALKVSDQHFKKIFEEYHEVDHQIHGIETGAHATTDEHLNGLRMHRVHLKDSIFKLLNA